MGVYDDTAPLLHFSRLTGIIRKIPDRNFLATREIFTARETEESETFTRDIVYGHRTPAKFNPISAPAQVSAHEKIAKQSFRLGEVKIKRRLDERTLLYARRQGTEDEAMAMGWIQKTLDEMSLEIDETREKAYWDALAGNITVDNRTDAQNPVYWSTDYNVTKYNSPAVNGWVSSPAEKILSNDLTKVFNFYRDQVGIELARAITTSEVTDGIIKNAEIISWYKATNNDVLNTQILSKLSKLQFQAYDEGYESTRYAASVTKYIPANTVYILPAGNDRIQATTVEGPSLIPKNAFGMGGDVLEKVSPGKFAYVTVTDDPVGLWIYAGLKFTPVIYWPEAVLKMTVV